MAIAARACGRLKKCSGVSEVDEPTFPAIRESPIKHVFETDRSIHCDRLAQRVVGEDDFQPCRLAMIPFHEIVRPVWTDHSVPHGDFVP